MVRAGVAVRDSAYTFPYFGAGLGAMRVDRAYGPSSVRSIAYQGIGGVAVPMPWVHGLSLTLEYRFMGLVDADGSGCRAATATTPAASATASSDNDMNHSLMVGLRYAFGGGGR
jgi:opacity protein-like surface antigen